MIRVGDREVDLFTDMKGFDRFEVLTVCDYECSIRYQSRGVGQTRCFGFRSLFVIISGSDGILACQIQYANDHVRKCFVVIRID